jgi:hypothetical protein
VGNAPVAVPRRSPCWRVAHPNEIAELDSYEGNTEELYGCPTIEDFQENACPCGGIRAFTPVIEPVKKLSNQVYVR